MKILLANKYFYPRGGAEISFFETAKLLERKGHQVASFSMRHPNNLLTPFEKFFVSSVEYDKPSWSVKLKALGRLFYSFEARRALRSLLKDFQPGVAHLNSIAHQLSPSILHELKETKVPIVMTLRDFKLVCPSYSLLAKGKPCERCTGGRYYHAIGQRCHKDSLLTSALVAAEMTLHHHILHIYDNVDFFISPSRFLIEKVKEMGFNRQIIHLPNFVDTKDYHPSFDWQEKSVVYFGRLSKEKGLLTLIESIKGLEAKLYIIGEGPQKADLENKIDIDGIKNVHLLGYRKGEELYAVVKRTMFVVLPSECYENNPRMIIEAFALGKPVIGSRIGGIPELVEDKETGLLFTPGDSYDLREKIQWLMNNPDAIATMGRQARAFVEKELNPDRHYAALMQVYHQAILKATSL